MRGGSIVRQHTDREYEGELRKLREQVLLMGAKVEELITGSVLYVDGGYHIID